ncbi:unnamed protein product [Kuraishia capsulata CBS 1993]|uniref:Protoporphyrinogen oxidase n=1 Tax=Kuraishia capsulata CBS 1993 TaxID=1382522 RepID=W6MG32_9ASCO|nr:uncharacterized protein KUCA_T00000916001 [Kuraishia capsulata CBS 1993]CDK24949.1 unnamed protein product [Kuraishia capsulata CBS 1993]
MSVLKQNAKVAVIGSGISGLSFAYYLSKLRPDVKVSVFEATDRVGGYIRTTKHSQSGLMLEKGPRTLRGASVGTLLIIDTILKLGRQKELMGVHKNSLSSKRYLLSNNKSEPLMALPTTLKESLRFLKDDLAKGMIPGIMAEPFKPKEHHEYDTESVSEFMERRFGSWSSNLISAVCHGVFAGSSKELGVDSFLPALAKLERDYGSVLGGLLRRSDGSTPNEQKELLSKYSELFGVEIDFTNLVKFLKDYPMVVFGAGLNSLPDIIYEDLLKHSPNVKFQFKKYISSVQKEGDRVIVDERNSFDHVKSTINVHRLSNILNNQNLKPLLNQITYSSVALVNVYIPSHNYLKDTPGFGYLVPLALQNDEKLLGVIFDSCNEASSRRLFEPAVLHDLKSGIVTPDQSKSAQSEGDYTKVTLMFGGHFYNETGFPTKDQLISSVERVLQRDLKIDLEAVRKSTIEIELIEDGIPQYNVGYQMLKSKIILKMKDEYGHRLSLGGMALGDGIGVPDCYLNGFKSALELSGVNEK